MFAVEYLFQQFVGWRGHGRGFVGHWFTSGLMANPIEDENGDH
jgi:hypothetical protein